MTQNESYFCRKLWALLICSRCNRDLTAESRRSLLRECCQGIILILMTQMDIQPKAPLFETRTYVLVSSFLEWNPASAPN